jgi:CrcB protein
MALALITLKVKTALQMGTADNAYLNGEPKVGKRMQVLEIGLLSISALTGAFLRYKIVESSITIGGLPINVLIVNIIGSLILGLFSVMALGLNLDAKYALLIAVGFCGSFTTMSSFALETSNYLTATVSNLSP